MKRTIDARTGLEVLDRDECLRLLAGDEVGRLAVVDGGAPVIFPVNYRLDGEAIVFRTTVGTKLDIGPRGPVAFEVDSFDRAARTGWSVLATGRLEVVTRFDPATYERVQDLPVEPWAGGDRPHWMRLVPSRITGRRIVPSG
jgi:nitroimidazol reductase NimA-like FMN-containing flavoprotein (pyridoxamine 5'-phosphate oxidase superfamily)